MRSPSRFTLAIWLFTVTLTLSSALHAADGKVIVAGGCDYILLDSSEGQILIKLIKGESPKPGDTLSGKLERGFSDLTNKRTGEIMQVWVDLVDRGATKALMRYGQYCS